jgi:hypothetical protein
VPFVREKKRGASVQGPCRYMQSAFYDHSTRPALCRELNHQDQSGYDMHRSWAYHLPATLDLVSTRLLETDVLFYRGLSVVKQVDRERWNARDKLEAIDKRTGSNDPAKWGRDGQLERDSESPSSACLVLVQTPTLAAVTG